MRTKSIAAAVIAAAAGSLWADSIDLTYVGPGEGNVGIVVEQFSQDLNDYVEIYDGYAGSLRHRFGDNGTGEATVLNGLFDDTFCAELTERIQGSTQNYALIAPEDLPVDGDGQLPYVGDNADRLRVLYAYGIDQGYLTEFGAWNSAGADAATAFQIILWEAAFDSDDDIDLTDGDLRFSGFGAGVDPFLTEFANAINDNNASESGLRGLAFNGQQDQLVVIPAPSVLALPLVGALFASRRRRSA